MISMIIITIISMIIIIIMSIIIIIIIMIIIIIIVISIKITIRTVKSKNRKIKQSAFWVRRKKNHHLTFLESNLKKKF